MPAVASGHTFLIDAAMSNGGWLGLGPGERFRLPDSHTDFALTIFVEDVGILILCLALLAPFVFIVIRRLWRAHTNEDN